MESKVSDGYVSSQSMDAWEKRSGAGKHGIQLEVVKHTEAKRGFVLPRRWVVERSFAWAARFRRLAGDYQRLSSTVAGLHCFAFVCLMLARLIKLLNGG
jgi:transposase